MGKGGFGYRTTAEQVTDGIDASDLTVIVTGATSGIGTETVRVLALRGAHVYLTGRTVESATAAKDDILKKVPDAKLDILPLDLSSQASVRKCAESFLALDQPLNILINNAGVMMTPYGLTEDGIETQFATNHIGHFLLTNLLLDKLKDTANKTGIESRIVIVSSAAIAGAKDAAAIEWDKISEKKRYNPYKQYGLSKLANVYHAQELARRLQEDGIVNVTVNSLHPGAIFTNLGKNLGNVKHCLIWMLYGLTFPFWKSIPQGSATTCFVSLHPSVKGVSGQYFSHCKEFKATNFSPIAEDENLAKQLWDVSVQLTAA